MDNWDSLHIEQIKDNTAKMAEAFTRIADALERYARRGSWEVRPAPEDDRVLGRRRYYCSECGGWNTYGESDFCPRCGADMRRDEMITDCPWR